MKTDEQEVGCPRCEVVEALVQDLKAHLDANPCTSHRLQTRGFDGTPEVEDIL